MQSYQQIWSSWAIHLKKMGIHEWVAALLEGAGPFNVLAAQLVYLGEPLARFAVPGIQVQALASLLEDPAEARGFAELLREAQNS